MNIVTRAALAFREWPTIYRLAATIKGPDQSTMASSWERIGDERGEPYCVFTRSG